MKKIVAAFLMPFLSLAACGDGAVQMGKGDTALQISKYDAVDIVKAGGGVTVSAEKLSKYDLTDIAQAAAATNARVEVVGSSHLSKYDMVDIGKAAPGLVTFRE